MVENINKRIIEKIKSDDIDQTIKDFLIDILRLEFKHFEDNKWKYNKEYERLIKQYLIDYKVKQ